MCYAKGTMISTPNGPVPIEDLKEGDLVVTKGKISPRYKVNATATLKTEGVKWISRFTVADLDAVSRPVCIKKGALGLDAPFEDLYVSPNHGVFVEGKMVSAKNLVNGSTVVVDAECTSVEYYHLECENHCLVFANGVPAETFRENTNRYAFEPLEKVQVLPQPIEA